MAFRWRADDGPTLNAGLVALWFSGDPDQYYWETLYLCLCFFRAGGGGFGPLPPPPLDPRMLFIMYTIDKWYNRHSDSVPEYFLKLNLKKRESSFKAYPKWADDRYFQTKCYRQFLPADCGDIDWAPNISITLRMCYYNFELMSSQGNDTEC